MEHHPAQGELSRPCPLLPHCFRPALGELCRVKYPINQSGHPFPPFAHAAQPRRCSRSRKAGGSRRRRRASRTANPNGASSCSTMALTTPARTLPVYQEYLLPPAQTGGFEPPGFKSEGVFPWGSSRWVQGPLARRSFGEQSGRCPRHSAALPLHPALIKTEHVSLLIWSAALKRDALQSRSKAASCKTEIFGQATL